MRSDARKRTADHLPHYDAGVREVIARERAAALREAARYFEYEMAPAWGGDSHWLSTGSRVADLVADILRERARDEVTP